ncbi:MAG: glycosyltransferase family 2 protein [Proteobacteria bacterium]|jgi:cellulose synthase/poly-beta-1,6-N-acetylglucosamine synthase-like glycosyltransferase|nr:glycosyltransferase family 2 protein [Pseudomonadota bacterium]
MSTLLVLGYWLLAAMVVFPYIGYPLTLWLLIRLRGPYRPVESGDHLPGVTLIISAFNEAAVLDAKLNNARALDYPTDKLQIVVISDASDDGTDDIVLKHAAQDSRVVLHRQEERRGKTAGLNHGIEKANGEVVVFSDANAMYEAAAIRELVAPLADPKVGYVVGAAHYSDGDAGQAQHSEGLYWRYELAIKEMESAFGSVVGGDGAIYAIRRGLFWPLREDDINDFVNPLQIIAAGYRGVFNPKARCYEEGADSFGKEFKRKRRIVNRSWRAWRRYGAGVRNADNPAFLFQIVAHKIIRWFAMPLIALLAVVNLLLVVDGHAGIYLLSLLGLLLSAVLAVRGHQLNQRGEPQPKLVYLFYYFYLVNWAALLGIYDEFRGVRHSKWDHVRSATPASGEADRSAP